jgi:tetratricopeptide (TPR) repeat protein
MSNPPGVWERLKQAHVARIVVVYLGASWILLQVASLIVDAFKLPDGVMPAAIILLFLGLIVVVATAWVQSLASTTAGEQSGDLPTDWQIAPRDALASLRRGRLPHLTWGRVLTGGVVMLSLLFGGVGTYVGMRGGIGGPSPLHASEALVGIAVVPFDVQAQKLDISGEGMMTLLANGLDGVGGFRTIDTRTVLARWNHEFADGSADLDAVLAVAKSTGARYLLQGSVVATGASVRLAAQVYDVDSGSEVASGQAEGPSEDVMRLVDELAVGTMRELLKAAGRDGATDESAETITTSSLPALRAYLEGEAHYRKGSFADAVQSYEKAVAADSTFAIALVRLSEAYGWLENANSARLVEVGRRAIAQAHRLSPRYQFIMTGWEALNRLSPDGLPSLREAVRKYPDDPGAWFLLAETYIHVGGATYATPEDIRVALDNAATLDPTFAPYLVHVAEYAIVRGDSAKANATLEKYEELGGNRRDVAHIHLAKALVLGNDADADSATKAAATMDAHQLDSYGGTFGQKHDRFDRDDAINVLFAKASGVNRTAFMAYAAGSMGALARGSELINDPAVGAPDRALYPAFIYILWNVEFPAGSATIDECPPTHLTCVVMIGTALAVRHRWAEQERVIATLRERAAAATDSGTVRRMNATADVLRGIAMHRRGDSNGARELLTRYKNMTGNVGLMTRQELGWIEAETNRPAEAIRYFDTTLDGYMRPVALYGIATMFEKLNQPDSAQIYWAHLVKLTEKGEALPRIVEARNALARSAQGR